MKIVNTCENITTTFDKINVGEAFYYNYYGGIYLKTESLFDDNGNVMTNAVNLRLGSMCLFPDNEKVIALDCECVIKDNIKEALL